MSRLAENRRKVLMAGMEVFADKGYKGATVRDIVSRVDANVNAISLLFGSKEDLATAVVETLKETIVTPVVRSSAEITSDLAWRTAIKAFVRQVVGLFHTTESPNCYFAALYRHESANLHAKKVTLHHEIMEPLFRQLEALIALGVAAQDRVKIRLATLSLWNGILAFALKHPDVLAADVPEGVVPELFREMAVDYMVDSCLKDLALPACL